MIIFLKHRIAREKKGTGLLFFSQCFRCNHSPLAGESQSQLVGDAVRGQNILDNQCSRTKIKTSKKINFSKKNDFLVLFFNNNFLIKIKVTWSLFL
jgi:hypothetical protein